MGKLIDLFKVKSSPQELRRLEGEMVDIDIVGEMSYQEHIRRVDRRTDGGEFDILLQPEPENRYDRNAVAVLAYGQPVGYLPREMASVWQPALLQAAAKGYVAVGTAVVFGGTARKKNVGVFGKAPWPLPGPPPRAAVR